MIGLLDQFEIPCRVTTLVQDALKRRQFGFAVT
jgi:hypothetical protein